MTMAPQAGSMEPTPRQVAWFFALALSWTWGALGLGWLSGASATEPPTSWLRLLAGIGPLAAAVLVLHRTATAASRRTFWRRVITVRPVRTRWWVVTAVVAAGPGVLVWAVADGRDFDVSGPGPALGVVAFAAAASLAEEPGWRGYALDGLRARTWLAVVSISAVWAIWHFPLYAIDGTFQHDDVGFGTTFFWLIQGGLVPQTILMIWILDHTSPSILPAVGFHALVNISGEVFEYSDTQQALRLGLWILAAGVVVIAWWRGDHEPSSGLAGVGVSGSGSKGDRWP